MSIQSRSEKDILNGCCALLDEFYKKFLDYLTEEEVDFEREPTFRVSNMILVQMLFFWDDADVDDEVVIEKCNELGLKYAEDFYFKPEEEWP